MNHGRSATLSLADRPTLFGHPAGLYTLFFAEMWERFSFYGVRALLTLYLVKGLATATAPPIRSTALIPLWSI